MARRSRLGGSAGEFTLRVEGLRDLQRDLNKVNKAAKGEVREGLKAVGRIVQDEARLIAKVRGLHDTGQLRRKITPAVTQQAVFIRANAKRAGYPYPAVYEYGRGGARAFLLPAAQRKSREVEQAMERWLDALLDKSGL